MQRLSLPRTLFTILALVCAGPWACAADLSAEHQARVLAAYPTVLDRIEGNTLIWRDGTRMPIDDGERRDEGAGDAVQAENSFDNADIEDMFRTPYVPFGAAVAPLAGSDPGRARSAALFEKLYGDCRTGDTAKNLAKVAWLPKKNGGTVLFATAHGAADALRAVSAELDALPATFDPYLVPHSGTFNCRVIAGTARVSAHGYGIAIDIATRHADYWRWASRKSGAGSEYRNKIPLEIVRIFEAHGFIWGGRWSHYDTMHFEFRPELLPAMVRSDTTTTPNPTVP